MPHTRNPFPFPTYENDNTFTGTRRQQSRPSDKPVHLAHNEEPWSRLNGAATLASHRRHVLYHDVEAPNDSLDFHLKSMYDHHKEFLRRKNETLFQRETLAEDHGRILKNRVEPMTLQTETELRVWLNPQRGSIFSIQGTIESHHNASTNRGYSRKHDGGFYST